MMNSSHVAGVYRVTVLVIKIMSHLLCKKHMKNVGPRERHERNGSGTNHSIEKYR